jgi:hypothetical protein
MTRFEDALERAPGADQVRRIQAVIQGRGLTTRSSAVDLTAAATRSASAAVGLSSCQPSGGIRRMGTSAMSEATAHVGHAMVKSKPGPTPRHAERSDHERQAGQRT